MALPTTSAETSSNVNTVAPVESPPKVSMLQTFLSVRGLVQPDHKPRRRSVQTFKPPKLTAELLSTTYTKRRHGQRCVAQRSALREPDDIFIESVDAYVPIKRAPKLLNLHKDEQEVTDAYLTASRALFFERDVLDRVVCDREENRSLLEERLWGLVANDQEVDDDNDCEGELKQQQDEETEEQEQHDLVSQM
ncbi:hypothetical protein PHYBOEH_011058 [Phytophthora boehmeriae]|uniref:Uncharacterized protein n=1 Tax=Phytophthora boehmeriae TaxID=109152 RepID=A0A8T1XDJ1_9STRA|nr:hypothetical protein PHYBOEH_011058 [Phytophthora boehmeriae]